MNLSPLEVIEERIAENERMRAGYTRQLLENPENAFGKLSRITDLTGTLTVLYELRGIPPEKWASHAIEKLIKASQQSHIYPSGVEIQLNRAMNDTWAWVAQGGFNNPSYRSMHRSPEEVMEMLSSFMKLQEKGL